MIRLHLWGPVLCAGLLACATGADGEADLLDGPAAGGDDGAAGDELTGPTGSGAGPSSGAGAGGSTSTGTSSGGAGSGGSAGQGGSAGAGGSGPPPTATKVLFMSGGGTATVGAYTDVTTAMGWSTPLMKSTYDPIGLAVGLNDNGVALFRDTVSGELFATYYSGGMTWSPPVAPAAGLLAGPGGSALAFDGTVMHAVYRQGDQHVYAALDAGSWAPAAEVVGSDGPSPASLALDGTDPVILFVGADGDLYDQTRSGGAWQPRQAHGLADVAAVKPALVTLDAGPELLAVYVDAADNSLHWRARTAGSWSAPAAVPGADSVDPPTLVALPGGDALLGYRDGASHGYVTRFSGGAWDATPVDVSGTGATVICPPAIARGAQGADAELVFTDGGGLDYWTRLSGGTWTVPAFSGVSWMAACTVIAVR